MSGGVESSKYIGIGLALGVVFGAATGRMGLGIALGIIFGAAIAGAKARQRAKAGGADSGDSK